MTDKTHPTAHAEITAPISAYLRRIDSSGQTEALTAAASRLANVADQVRVLEPEGSESDVYLTEASKVLRKCAGRIAELEALQAAPPAPAAVAVPAKNNEGYLPCPFCGSDQASLSCGKNGDGTPWNYVECGFCAACTEPYQWNIRTALAAAPAQEHATQLAGQGQPYSIDADPEGIRARVAEAIAGALSSGGKKSDMPSDEHWLRPFWMHAYFGVAQYNALRDSAEAMLNAPGALTQAARDVLAERARQVDAKGFNHARDDKYIGLQLAGAAASYLILAAGGREDDARTFWPWRQEWLKPSEQRRYLEKAGALLLAEMERLDRAAARASQGGA